MPIGSNIRRSSDVGLRDSRLSVPSGRLSDTGSQQSKSKRSSSRLESKQDGSWKDASIKAKEVDLRSDKTPSDTSSYIMRRKTAWDAHLKHLPNKYLRFTKEFWINVKGFDPALFEKDGAM